MRQLVALLAATAAWLFVYSGIVATAIVVGLAIHKGGFEMWRTAAALGIATSVLTVAVALLDARIRAWSGEGAADSS